MWREVIADGPMIATAIHAGHGLRAEVAEIMALSEADRLREEDPYTDAWVAMAPTQLVAQQSRFEVDLNRPADKAVYRTPEDAWGLDVWREQPCEAICTWSMEQYHQFYARLEQLVADKIARYGRAVVFDLHSYNHHRQGPDRPYDDPAANPQINLGTSNMDLTVWEPMVADFTAALSEQVIIDGPLDVRCNVKFRGGNMAQWLHRRFGAHVAALAIEVKKFFMDEWTGEVDHDILRRMGHALEIAAQTVEDRLK